MTKRKRLLIIVPRAALAAWGAWKFHEGCESRRLIRELKSPDLAKAHAAAEALSTRSDMIAVNGVVDLLGTHNDAYVPQVRHVVMRMGQPGIDRLIAVGIRRRTDTFREARCLCSYGSYSERHRVERDILVRIGSPCIPKVLPFLNAKYPDVRSRAVEVLGAMSDPAAVDPVIKALDDSADSVAVVEGLAYSALRNPINPRIVDRLWELAYSGNRDIRPEAIRALCGSPDPQHAEHYMKLLETADSIPQESRGYVERMLTEALAALGDARAVPMLIGKLKSSRASRRPVTLKALGRIGGQKAADAIAPYCDDADEYVRSTAVDALGAAGCAASADILIAHIGDKAPVGYKVALALGRLRDERAVPALIAVPVWPDAAIALGDIGDAKATEALREALSRRPEDPDDKRIARLTTAAAIALFEIGTPDAIAAAEEQAEGRDLSEIAASYRKYIEAGDEADLVPLMLALARYGNLEMARAFFYCENEGLRNSALSWADHALAGRETLYNRGHEADYPTWGGW